MKMLRISTLIASLGLLAAPLAAVAEQPQQQQPQPQPQTQPEAPKADFSEQEINQFVAVYSEITEIRQTYQSELASAENREEAQKIQEKMSNEIMAKIEESPISMDLYQEITRASSRDPEFRDELIQRINENGGSSES